MEILDTESAQTEQTGQETATATPATSQTTPETTTEPKPKNLTYQTGLYQEKTLADQVSVDAVRELPEGEYGVLSYSYDETVSVWGNGAEDCLVMIHDGDREYKVDVLWQNMYSAPPAVEAADYDGGWRQGVLYFYHTRDRNRCLCGSTVLCRCKKRNTEGI